MDYRSAGVDLAGADAHVDRIRPLVTATWGSEVVGGFGDFSAGVRIPPGYRNPVLMMSTDGVGTKLEVARRARRWEGVGFDLVAMSVDDLVVSGARPLAFVDYMAVGALDPDRDASIVGSIAEACRVAGCALVGGETAEHPGTMAEDGIDLAGAALGVVEGEKVLGSQRTSAGDRIIGLRSPNLRSNGFSLVRQVFADVGLETPFPEEEATVAEVLLRPSIIYAPAVLEAIAVGGVHAAAHITGGGLVANLARSVPDGMEAVIDHWSWEWPNVFTQIQRRGGVSVEEMRRTFNLGIGFCLIVDPAAVDEVSASVATHDPAVIGEIRPKQ
ncbi:MAG TPA: phosphoribosylformylglycinamidine cyclo-ligase [Acidimicrobiia bacterium]|nr:phosphoribosylformylglycinamidine cyclo-ligase [Acidimicrobiia bacterium]